MLGRGTEKTEVYYNPFRAVSTLIDFIDNATGQIDGCVDQTRPLLLNDIEALRISLTHIAAESGVRIIMMEKELLLVLVCPWTRGFYEINHMVSRESAANKCISYSTKY